jgi:hypothetical protein
MVDQDLLPPLRPPPFDRRFSSAETLALEQAVQDAEVLSEEGFSECKIDLSGGD